MRTVPPGRPDPAPEFREPGTMVDGTGGRVEVEAVSVDVPAGAVQDGERITVSIGEPIGIVEGPYATEIGGRPVRVEHNRALAGPLTLTWRVPELTEAQRATLVLVKWNPRDRSVGTTRCRADLGRRRAHGQGR